MSHVSWLIDTIPALWCLGVQVCAGLRRPHSGRDTEAIWRDRPRTAIATDVGERIGPTRSDGLFSSLPSRLLRGDSDNRRSPHGRAMEVLDHREVGLDARVEQTRRD